MTFVPQSHSVMESVNLTDHLTCTLLAAECQFPIPAILDISIPEESERHKRYPKFHVS